MSPERRRSPERSLSGLVRRRPALVGALSSACGFVLWTLLVTHTSLLAGLDAWGLHRHLTPDSGAEQVWAAISIVTMPVILAVALAMVSLWAWQRRLRNLAWGLLVAILLAWPASHLAKVLVRRPRPAAASLELITNHGPSYPSGHMTMATAAAVMVIATTTATRQSNDVRYLWRFLCGGGVLLVAADRLLLDAHWPSDVVGGFLLGGLCASLACLLAEVHMLPIAPASGARAGDVGARRVAVIWNPTKVGDRSSFRRTIDFELERHGWGEALWLATRVDDPGIAMTRAAIEAKVDLVIVAGGDGTVRVVCSELAGTGIALGIIPAGTGNLLARNLRIPLDEVAAARVAVTGTARPIDLVRVTVDGHHERAEHFAVMAGIGIDAQIMDATNPELKKTVGSAAYFLAAAKLRGGRPMDLTFQVDDGPVEHRSASVAVVGNVGYLQGGIELLPSADPTDGLLDVIVASPRGMADWATMAARVLTRRREEVDRVDELRGRKVRFTVAEELPYELDGDTEGRASVFEAEVVPGALLLMQR